MTIKTQRNGIDLSKVNNRTVREQAQMVNTQTPSPPRPQYGRRPQVHIHPSTQQSVSSDSCQASHVHMGRLGKGLTVRPHPEPQAASYHLQVRWTPTGDTTAGSHAK
ncbi:hypothetical protein HispidOSU_002320 [Sigmodon hispidus]